MSNVFITYGDKKFRKSLKRIKKQAKEIGIFDKIITYSPKDLPLYIKCSPLFASNRGGGYWLWKPYIIKKTLEKCEEGDIVYYIDAGCSLNNQSPEWNIYKESLKNFDSIVFQYKSDYIYEGWENYCKIPENNSPSLKHWIKPLTKDYFSRYFGSEDYIEYNKIMGGILIIKKTSKIPLFISEWFNISLFYPELICDPFGEDLNRLPNTFNEHRHDQAIITPLVFFYKDFDKILVLPETSESNKQVAAIIASRRVDWTWNLCDKFRYHINTLIKKLII
jgi:hypothetical protein